MNYKPSTTYEAIYKGTSPHKRVEVIGIKTDRTKAYIIEDQRHHLIVDIKDLKSLKQSGKRTVAEDKLLKGKDWL